MNTTKYHATYCDFSGCIHVCDATTGFDGKHVTTQYTRYEFDKLRDLLEYAQQDTLRAIYENVRKLQQAK